MTIYDRVAEELNLATYDVDRYTRLRQGIIVDAIIHAGDEVYLVELKARTAKAEDLAQLNLYRDLWTHQEGHGKATPVLVAPGASSTLRHLADELRILVVDLPVPALPTGMAETGTTPLTTAKSWSVIVTLLLRRRFRTFRQLSEEAHASIGWTHRVVAELEARGAVVRRAGGIELEDEERVLDGVAAERPLDDLEVARFPTGHDTARDLSMELMTRWNDLHRPGEAVGPYQCGVTAAAFHSGYSIHGDRFDVYCEAPEKLASLWEDREGGIQVRVYEPDRSLGPTSEVGQGLPVVSREQALLDVAGTGLAFRDLATALLEVMRR